MARTGERRNLVNWQQYTIENISGQAKKDYVDRGNHWACVLPLSGREAIIAKQLRADVTHSIEMLKVGDVKPMDRFLYGTKILEVSSVTETDEIGWMLKIIAVEVVQ